MKAAILNDVTRCVGCGACALACKEVNGLPAGGTNELSATTWSALDERGGHHVRRQCMHCLEPACVSVCPVGALQKTAEGPVIYDESRCIGCRYCMVACPFGVPRYEWNSPLPRVQKCVMCYHKRLSEGKQPACTEACPAGATVFGERDALIHEARRRIDENPGRYIDHIYGLNEAGGTSVLYLSDRPFEEIGFTAAVRSVSYPKLTWGVLSKIPYVVSIGGTMLFGIWWLANRKELLERVRAGKITLEEAQREMPALLKDHDKDLRV